HRACWHSGSGTDPVPPPEPPRRPRGPSTVILLPLHEPHRKGEPGAGLRALLRALESEDRRRAERLPGQAGQAPGRVRVAPPRTRGRALPRGEGPPAHAAA